MTDFLLTFIVPSGIARVVIMASIALGLAEAFKSGAGSNVLRGMFLILSYTANIFDKMIIAGAGSITARGQPRAVRRRGIYRPALAFLACACLGAALAGFVGRWQHHLVDTPST